MFASCTLLLVACCLLFVVYGFDVCSLLLFDRCDVFVVCCSLFVVCRSLVALCCLLLADYCFAFVVCP